MDKNPGEGARATSALEEILPPTITIRYIYRKQAHGVMYERAHTYPNAQIGHGTKFVGAASSLEWPSMKTLGCHFVPAMPLSVSSPLQPGSKMLPQRQAYLQPRYGTSRGNIGTPEYHGKHGSIGLSRDGGVSLEWASHGPSVAVRGRDDHFGPTPLLLYLPVQRRDETSERDEIL